MNVCEILKERQLKWAENKGLSLRQIGEGTSFYVRNLKDNLFRLAYNEDILKEIRAGNGNELKKGASGHEPHLYALHSSCAL